jgi:RNA polymerase primary sigma factor
MNPIIPNKLTKPLTREQEQETILMAQAGDKDAADKVILGNYRFVIRVCHGYQHRGLELDDLISEGCMGLMRAIQTYTPASGNKFITYAVWWIRAYVTKAIIEQGGIVRIPANFHTRMKGKTQEEQDDLNKQYEEYREIIRATRSAPSMDAMLDSGIDFADPGPSPDQIISEKMNGELLEMLLANLKPKDSGVIRARYGLETGVQQTLKEIADVEGVSRERIRQREAVALEKLSKVALHYRRRRNPIAI